MSNVVAPPVSERERPRRGDLRPIVIDGCNVAVGHGRAAYNKQGVFSARGLDICINYFLRRGHEHVIAIVPHDRIKAGQALNRDVLKRLENSGHLIFTPAMSYDDRYILQYAAACGGIVVSNDFYRDLHDGEGPEVREVIKRQVLPFTWIREVLMFPKDPLGRFGPSLDDFLKF